MNHEYSTVLVLISLFIGGVFVVNGILSEDVDELCSTDGSILKRVSGEWNCSTTAWAQGYFHDYYSPIQVHFTAADTYANISVYENITASQFIVDGNSVEAQKTGLYKFSLSMSFNGGNGGEYELELFVNDIKKEQCTFFMSTSTTEIRHASFVCILPITQGDHLILKAKDTTAPAQDIWYYQLNMNTVEIQ